MPQRAISDLSYVNALQVSRPDNAPLHRSEVWSKAAC